MKLFPVAFLFAFLLFSLPIIVSSYSLSTSGQTSFSPLVVLNPMNIRNRTLTSPNVQSDGYFGYSISVSGELVAVGAAGETADGYSYAGHGYVYNLATGRLVSILTSPNAQTQGVFGLSISISGKLVTVGAPSETADGYQYGGHSYIFNANTGKLIETLTSPNAQYDGEFGNSVAMSGELVTVGAPRETANGYSGAGHAYVFNSMSGKLIEVLTSPNAQDDGYFGYSVFVTGKLVTVGAPQETADGNYQAGHAYLFNSGTGKLIANLTSPNAQIEGFFGLSVSASGKLVTVGAPQETADGYAQAGHAYVFNANTGKLIETLTSPNAESAGGFGFSVSMSGKLNAVGAPTETADGYQGAGNVYVFNSATGKLVSTVTSPNAQTNGVFGASISMSEKLLTIGAPEETAHGYTYAGHAHIFYGV